MLKYQLGSYYKKNQLQDQQDQIIQICESNLETSQDQQFENIGTDRSSDDFEKLEANL